MTDIPILVCGADDHDYPFDDNVHGHCGVCGTGVVWRPHSPDPSTKMCGKCAFEEIAEMDEEPQFEITPESLAELRNMLK